MLKARFCGLHFSICQAILPATALQKCARVFIYFMYLYQNTQVMAFLWVTALPTSITISGWPRRHPTHA